MSSFETPCTAAALTEYIWVQIRESSRVFSFTAQRAPAHLSWVIDNEVPYLALIKGVFKLVYLVLGNSEGFPVITDRSGQVIAGDFFISCSFFIIYINSSRNPFPMRYFGMLWLLEERKELGLSSTRIFIRYDSSRLRVWYAKYKHRLIYLHVYFSFIQSCRRRFITVCIHLIALLRIISSLFKLLH